MATPHNHSRWKAWWPFALLCLVGATRGFFAGAFPGSTTTLLSFSSGCAAAALVLLFTSRTSPLLSKRIEPRPLIGAVLLLSGPLFALILTGHGIDPNSLTLALALVPIVATITRSALDDTPPGSFAARTWPALAALAGLLLLVPQPSFTNPITDTVLILAPLATGIGAALFSTSYSSTNASSLPIAISAAALLFSGACLVQFLLHHTTAHLSPLSSLLDAVTAFATLLALQRVGLTRWSAQFALVPLAVVLQAFILLRPGLDAYNSAGIALLLLGVIFLLLPQPLEKAP